MSKTSGEEGRAGYTGAYRGAYRGADDFPRAYIRLRTVLDGLEISALRFCLDEKSVAKKLKRIQELEELIMPIVQRLQDRTIAAPPGACGEGLYNCGGVCVPYQCPSK